MGHKTQIHLLMVCLAESLMPWNALSAQEHRVQEHREQEHRIDYTDKKTLSHLIEQCIRKDQIDSALKWFWFANSKGLTLNENSYVRLSNSLSARNDKQTALKVLKVAESSGLRTYGIYVTMGKIQTQFEEYDTARATFAACKKMAPDKSEPYWRTGVILALQNNNKQAITQYTKALELARKHPRPKLTEPVTVVAGVDLSDEEYSLFSRGQSYIALRMYPEAVKDYTSLMSLGRPPSSAWYGNRGLAYSLNKQYDKSILDYNKSNELTPGEWRLLLNRATSYFYLKKFDKAIEDYTTVIKMNPTDEDLYMERSFAYLNAGMYEKALADVSKAQELDKDKDVGLYYLAKSEIYRTWGKGQLAASFKKKAKDLGSDVSDPDPWGEKKLLRSDHAPRSTKGRR